MQKCFVFLNVGIKSIESLEIEKLQRYCNYNITVCIPTKNVLLNKLLLNKFKKTIFDRKNFMYKCKNYKLKKLVKNYNYSV